MVRIHIDRLSLEGPAMSESQAKRLQTAVESELGQLVREGQLSSEVLVGGALRRISVPPVPEHAEHAPTGLGRQIARAIFRGIGDERKNLPKRENAAGGRRSDKPAARARSSPTA